MHPFAKALEVTKNSLFWKWFNFAQIFFWIALGIVAFALGWMESTVFVSFLSITALVLSAQSSWQSSRNERKEDVRDPDTPT